MISHSKPTLSNEEFEAMKEVYFSNMIAAGKKVKEFRERFSVYVQKRYVELFSSGTNALYNLLLALNVSKGDQVLIPAYICDSVEKAILKANAEPVYYDNMPNSWISSCEEIKKYITKRTKVIIVNHTFGIRYLKGEVACLKELGISLIEDNAHFISNKKEDVEVSNLFDVSFYSFDATKLLTTGNGGAIATNNSYLIQNIKLLDKGFSDLNAALGVVQLRKLDFFLKRRKEIAEFYIRNLGDIAKDIKRFSSIYFRFPIFVKNDAPFLNSENVAFRKGVDKILGKLPNVREIFKKTICLPIYPSLTENEINIIIKETLRLYKEL